MGYFKDVEEIEQEKQEQLRQEAERKLQVAEKRAADDEMVRKMLREFFAKMDTLGHAQARFGRWLNGVHGHIFICQYEKDVGYGVGPAFYDIPFLVTASGTIYELKWTCSNTGKLKPFYELGGIKPGHYFEVDQLQEGLAGRLSGKLVFGGLDLQTIKP